ncbi:NAD(+) diphosphatase [Lysobacter arvi]|uniref:NAD(+) diphosphatase n=1 Tax=Lysobacter arvi TaxID=3038776 RepID=A0ABU1CFV8_9GAMM|nr:NAD(+) diphosphatase [Lysobacter arvi]MDR0183835.1 NAD(+) diphosphatase [Lysobacter arvi]
MSDATAPFAFVEAGADAACHGALDRADRLRDDPDALKSRWPAARVILLDEKGNAYADEAGHLFAATGQDVSEGPGGVGAAVFLGLDPQDNAWFALDGALTALDAPRRVDLRSAAAFWPAFDASVFAQARALQHWRSRHRFCGVCGGEVALSRAGWQGTCTKCGVEHYPRTDPAVIVAVTDGSRLLLGRQAAWPARRYSVLAGFVEPGESLEQTVAREVLEEAGVRVRRCRYLASQPWPFPGSLMLGFHADAEPDAPQVGDELEEARWFTADDVRRARLRGEWGSAQDDGEGPVLSPSISISRWLIEQWLAGQGGA